MNIHAIPGQARNDIATLMHALGFLPSAFLFRASGLSQVLIRKGWRAGGPSALPTRQKAERVPAFGARGQMQSKLSQVIRTTLLIALLFPFILTAQDLSAERKLYLTAHSNEQASHELLKLTQADKDTISPVHVAYHGAALMVAAQFANGISGKLKLFKQGKSLMTKATQAAPESVEVRFLRMTVQDNAPPILMYNDDLQQDKDFILVHFSAVKDAGLKNMIQVHARTSTLYSEDEKARLLSVR